MSQIIAYRVRILGSCVVLSSLLALFATALVSCGPGAARPESFLSPEDAETLAELERVYADLKDGGTIFFGQSGSLENGSPDDIWEYMDMCGTPTVELHLNDSGGEATDLEEQISAMPQVISCIYESGEEFLEAVDELLTDLPPEKVQNIRDNPPDSLNVTLVSSRDIPEFVAAFQDNPEIDDITSSLDLEGFLAFLERVAER